MYMKNFLTTNTSLISVKKKVISKMNDVSEVEIIDEFVGLQLNMYSIKNIVGKESNA